MTFSVYSVTTACSSAGDAITGAGLCGLRHDMISGVFGHAVVIHSDGLDLKHLVSALTCSHRPLLINAPKQGGGSLTIAFFKSHSDAQKTAEGFLYVPNTSSAEVYPI